MLRRKSRLDMLSEALLVSWLVIGISATIIGSYLYELNEVTMGVASNLRLAFPSISRLADKTHFPGSVVYWYTAMLLFLPFYLFLIIRNRTNTFDEKNLGLGGHIRSASLFTVFTVASGYVFFFGFDAVLGDVKNRFWFATVGSLCAYLLPLSAGGAIANLMQAFRVRKYGCSNES